MKMNEDEDGEDEDEDEDEGDGDGDDGDSRHTTLACSRVAEIQDTQPSHAPG